MISAVGQVLRRVKDMGTILVVEDYDDVRQPRTNSRLDQPDLEAGKSS